MLGPGATIERLKLERKRQGGEDYVATLKRLGFDRPLSLAGGWLRWVEAGGEVEGPAR